MGGIVLRGVGGDAQNLGGLFECHAYEIPQLDQFGLPGVLGCKLVKSFVHSEELVVGGGARQFYLLDVHPLLRPAVPHRTLRRALSIRMRRMASAAAAKKWARPAHS